MTTDLLNDLRRLRDFYVQFGGHLADLFSELIRDAEAGAGRKEIRADARALLKELEPGSTSYKLVRRYLAELKLRRITKKEK